MTSIKPKGFNILSTDVAVPISKLAEIIGTSEDLRGFHDIKHGLHRYFQARIQRTWSFC